MNISEALVREIVEKVVQTMLAEPASQPTADDFVKCKDPSGVLMVKTDTVRCEPFGGVPGVALKDIVTLQEAPRMGAGIMELDHGAQFEWTLNYDEYDIVLDGTLEIKIDGRAVSGQCGDIIYIPKGSHIFFATPNHARYAYFVYPADWQSQG